RKMRKTKRIYSVKRSGRIAPRSGLTGAPAATERAPPKEMARHAQARDRQQGLFLMVAARLAGAQAIGAALRGSHRPALRRGLGQAPRGRRIRAFLGQSADPLG